MKHYPLAITFLAVAAFSIGCKPSEEKAATQNREATAEQFDKVKKETKEAAQEMKDYAYAQKAEFVEKMQIQLAEINRDLESLSAKIEKSSDAAKAEAKPKLDALRAQTAKLNRQLDEARNATESTWESVKAGFKKAYGELKEGFQQARQWVSDKIAP
jgi:cytochrome c556